MATLSREQLKAKTTRRFVEVPVGDNGDTVRLQSITELEHSRWEAAKYKRIKQGDTWRIEPAEDAMESAAARLLAMCVVDDQGQRIFERWQEAAELDAVVSNSLYAAARKHCGLDKETDAEKNSDAIPA
jgi:hypothetical protein